MHAQAKRRIDREIVTNKEEHMDEMKWNEATLGNWSEFYFYYFTKQELVAHLEKLFPDIEIQYV